MTGGIIGGIPHGTVFPVEHIELRLDAAPHPIETANADAIARNWTAETAANPALFDGRVVLVSALSFADGQLAGRCHEVGFSTFMFWRKDRAISTAQHIFAHAALVSSDGALVAARMGPHTVNAGKVYFAAGSLEPDDFVDGKVDLHLNMAREVREETGLDIGGLRRDDKHHAYSSEIGTVIFRRYWLPETADETAGRIRDFIAAQAQSEITEPVIIRGPDGLPEGLLPHMKAIVDWHFGLV
jgi:8-oxo-dGTP pyrophosphatase MutT (NUDIX family)